MNEPKINYQKEMEKQIASFSEGEKPLLLLHSCCGPCSSYVLQYLTRFFRIALYYYNPNINPPEEYEHRLSEQKRLLSEMPFSSDVFLVESEYDPQEFFERVKGLETEPEGGARCTECFRLRLLASAQKAKKIGADYFTTTLTVSPHKNAPLLNQLGEEYGKQIGVPFLPSDFKKNGGYQESIRLSKEYGLYRQNYCGCVFSKE